MTSTRGKRRSRWWSVAALYGFFWLLTALFGISGTDRNFDRDFSMGSVGLGTEEKPEADPVAIVRIPFTPALREHAPASIPHMPENGVFRARSYAIPIAPFVIVDEAAWQTDALAGFSGHRVIFWFFGFTRWAPVHAYWVS